MADKTFMYYLVSLELRDICSEERMLTLALTYVRRKKLLQTIRVMTPEAFTFNVKNEVNKRVCRMIKGHRTIGKLL